MSDHIAALAAFGPAFASVAAFGPVVGWMLALALDLARPSDLARPTLYRRCRWHWYRHRHRSATAEEELPRQRQSTWVIDHLAAAPAALPAIARAHRADSCPCRRNTDTS